MKAHFALAAAVALLMWPQSASAAGCTPYGPTAGRQYRPSMFIAKLKSLYDPTTDEPLLAAHRGTWGHIDGKLIAENSKTAIEETGKRGIEAIELDVHNAGFKYDADSLVLLHDYTTGRVTDSSRGKHLWDPTWAGINSDRITVKNGEFYVSDDKDRKNTNIDRTIAQDEGNLDLRALTPADVEKMRLYAFDVNSNNVLGEFDVDNKSYKALGQYVETDDTVMSLHAALDYIGAHYPGMTVIVDLRHIDEVTAAMDTIDAVVSCDGRPASEWTILKPFANIFPDGWENASGKKDGSHVSVLSVYGDRARHYFWIPCISNRLAFEGKKGDPSKIPGRGPDTRKIPVATLPYLEDWNKGGVNFAGAEVGSLDALKTAREWLVSHNMRNLNSWRPPDLRSDSGDKGFNWKDDGLGIYPTDPTTVDGTKKVAGVIVIEDIVAELAKITANTAQNQKRKTLLQSISVEIESGGGSSIFP